MQGFFEEMENNTNLSSNEVSIPHQVVYIPVVVDIIMIYNIEIKGQNEFNQEIPIQLVAELLL